VEIILPGTALESGQNQQVRCRTTGSNPPALVTWWSGNKQLANTGNTVNDSHLISEYLIYQRISISSILILIYIVGESLSCDIRELFITCKMFVT